MTLLSLNQELLISNSSPTLKSPYLFVSAYLSGRTNRYFISAETKGVINIPSRDSTDPMNEITENGIYTIIPANDTYGTLIVFQSFGGAGGIVQFYAHPFGNGIYRFRIKTSNNKNEWSEWKNF